jgi:hypothetical protein
MRIEPAELTLPACVHCRWCGHLIYVPSDCLLHDGDCPEWRWELSEQCYGFTHLFLARTGTEQVKDSVMKQAEELALLHPRLGGTAIAEQIIDWLGF